MSLLGFDELLKNDTNEVYLGDFAIDVIYKSNNSIKPVKMQFFNDSLDKMEVLYDNGFCSYEDVPYIKKGDIFEIDSIEYGVVDFTIDPKKTSVDIFLQKV